VSRMTDEQKEKMQREVLNAPPHPLATENARLRELLEQCVSVFTDRGEERHPDEETVLDAARAALAGQPVAHDPRDEKIAALESVVKRAEEDVNWMLNSRKFLNDVVFEYLHAAADGLPTPAPQPDAVKVMREAAIYVRDRAKSKREFYEKNGPTWTSKDGHEYQDTTEHLEFADDVAAKIDAALAATEGVAQSDDVSFLREELDRVKTERNLYRRQLEAKS